MANVMHHHIEFTPRPVSHAPSPFSFGFGLGQGPAAGVVSSGWQPSSSQGCSNPYTLHQLVPSLDRTSTTTSPSHRPQKRRLEDDTDSTTGGKSSGNRDESMDRSPTPERPKRGPPKRARIAPAETGAKGQAATKEDKPSDSAEEDEVDVGVLLASLPPPALLSLMTALLKAQPSLKSSLLPLIPRPTLDTAIQALAQGAKKLRDAYPYSNVPSFSQTSFGFGMRSQNPSTSSYHNNGGMRDDYITSRLRPHITEFVAACTSYLPYFSCIPASKTPSSPGKQQQAPPPPSFAQLNKEKFLPLETFKYLAAITQHILDQPPLTQSSLALILIPRLADEWNAWVDKVDEIANRQGGMYGVETARTWESALDSFADAKGFEGVAVMKGIRDKWVIKVGWLVQRVPHASMDV